MRWMRSAAPMRRTRCGRGTGSSRKRHDMIHDALAGVLVLRQQTPRAGLTIAFETSARRLQPLRYGRSLANLQRASQGVCMSRKFFMVAVAVGALVATLPRHALAWGGDGHRTVGAIADLLLEQHPTTRDRVKQILG